MTKTKHNIEDFRGGVTLNYPVVRKIAGRYLITDIDGKVVGFIQNRFCDWYGEIAINGVEFYNSCGTGLADVAFDLSCAISSRSEYVRGRGKADSIKSCERLLNDLSKGYY